MKRRHWSIRSKITALVAVPLTAFLALWIFATLLTAGPALHLLNTRMMVQNIGDPGQVLIGELQRERRLSVEHLSGKGEVTDALRAQRAATDRAAESFRGSAGADDVRSELDPGLLVRMDQFFTDLAALRGQRAHIDRRGMDAAGAQGVFNEMMDAGFEMFVATAGFGDPAVDREIKGLTALGRGREYLSRVDSMLAGAIVSGRLTDAARGQMAQDVGTARFLLADGVSELPPADRAEYEQLTLGPTYTRMNSMLETLVTDGRGGAVVPVAADTWRDAYVAGAEALRQFELDAIAGLEDRTTPLAVRILVRLGLAAALGLIALIVTVYISLKVGRSIVGRLRRLRGEALEMASERLPGVVRRLQRGEVVDIAVETPPLEYGRDEIGQLGHAFNDVQRTAVQSAVEEANVRRGINEVFLNIARRSQTLLHRQLSLLDKMERRETEPQELEDLYRVDHLATRMRRHAEDLVILAGAAPGRGWRNPVPVIDVVRGAISEVEDYKRIDIRSVSTASVLGRAVGDVIHLLAELLENAASFSPPHTRVQVGGQVLPNGYAMEIEDRGLGMTPEAIELANRRLAEPPDFDPADSARLGLFVVAQLANRHGIRVSLRASAYGGITAIVFLPGDLVSAGPAMPSSGGAASPADRVWEQPLVGSGTEDPSRASLAALQWQGAEQLRQVTVDGRPVVDGRSAVEAGAGPIPRQRAEAPVGEAEAETAAGHHRAPVGAGGPAPSAVAEELSAEGLVQRRRVRRPTLDRDEAVPETRSVPRHSGAPDDTLVLPTLPSPTAPAPAPAPAAPAPAAPAPVAAESPAAALPAAAVSGEEPSLEDGLPRRTRQAHLAPQLRRPEGAIPPEPAVTFRSPDQVRSIMSALQQGTTRGRIDASRYAAGPDPINERGKPGIDADSLSEDRSNGDQKGNGGRTNGTSFADAATVSFPAVVNLAAGREEASSGGGRDAAGDGGEAPAGNDVTRPEKDA